MKKGKKLVKDIVKTSKNKGQALIEFILLLPIIFLIILTIIDVSLVFYNKNHLENVLNDVIILVNEKKSEEEIKSTLDNNVSYEISFNEEYATITLKQKIKPTSILSYILQDNFEITCKRVILYEQ